jgi:hypothetical protein
MHGPKKVIYIVHISTYSLEGESKSKEDSETERKQELPNINTPLILHRE